MLRPVQIQDLPQIREWAQKEEYAEYFRRTPPAFAWPDDVQLLSWFQSTYAIQSKEQALIGLAMLGGFDQLSRRAEMGAMIDKDKGGSSLDVGEACHALAQYAFDTLGLEKLYCLAFCHRMDVKTLLERAGFRLEGTLRRNIFYKGELCDENYFGLLASDYQEKR